LNKPKLLEIRASKEKDFILGKEEAGSSNLLESLYVNPQEFNSWGFLLLRTLPAILLV